MKLIKLGIVFSSTFTDRKSLQLLNTRRLNMLQHINMKFTILLFLRMIRSFS